MSHPCRWLSLLAGLLSPLSAAADELPPRALARLGDYRFYQENPIRCAAVSFDGQLVATGQGNAHDDADVRRTIILWDAATGRELRRLDVAEGELVCCAFSPDGKQLAVGCAGSVEKSHYVYVFDPETGKRVRRLGSFQNAVAWLQYSSDGKHLHVGEDFSRTRSDTAITSWDAASGERRGKWAVPDIAPRETEQDYTTWNVCAGQLSPDEKIVLWEIDVQTETPKGSVDFAKHQCVVRGYDAVTNQQRYELDGASRNTYQFSTDGKWFVLGSDPWTVREVATGKVHRECKRSAAFQGIVSLLPDGRRAVICAERESRLSLFDLETGRILGEPEVIRRGDNATCVVLSGSGKTLVSAGLHSARLWDLEAGKETSRPLGHPLPVNSLWFTPDGKTLISQCDELQCEWSVERGVQLNRRKWRIAGPHQVVRGRSGDGCIEFLAETGLGLREGEAKVSLRHSNTGKVVRAFEGITQMPFAAVLSPTGSRAVLMTGKYRVDVEWYDVATGKRVGEDKDVRNFTQACFSPNGRLLAWAARDEGIAVADTATGKPMVTLDPPTPGGRPRMAWLSHLLTFSSDGNLLVAAPRNVRPRLQFHKSVEGKPIRVFDVRGGKEITQFYLHPEDGGQSDAAVAIALSPDNRLLAVAENDTKVVRVVEMASGLTRLLLSGHRATVSALAFSPDGKTLASGGEDQVIYLWDVTGAHTKSAQAHAGLKDLDECLEALAGVDAVRAGDALTVMIGTPALSVSFLKERLHPLAAVDKKRLAELISDLDADAFEKREAASRTLAQMGEVAQAALRRALDAKPSAEAKRRLGELLERLESQTLSPEQLRAVRVIEVLEHIGTPEAEHLLAALAKGTPEARLTRDAKASLIRLTKP